MDDQQLPPSLSAKFVGSFAYVTIKDRLPVILTKVVDTLVRNKEAITQIYGQGAKEEIKEIINRLSKLKNEITTDKVLLDFVDNGEDVALWKEKIQEEAEKNGATGKASWFTSSWLLVECYMYRRIQEAFQLSNLLKQYDPFGEQKQNAFYSSLPAIISLANHLRDINVVIKHDVTTLKHHFIKFLQLALWGNKCDLSIAAGNDNYQACNPLTQLPQLQSFVLQNDSERIWNRLQRPAVSGKVRVDFILDNAGFELFTDLCFADFLLTHGLAEQIHFHVKQMPWFVSDVTLPDFHWTIENAAKGVAELSDLVKRWEQLMSDGVWVIHTHHFWTLPHDFSRMRSVAPQLYSQLAKAQLLVFKGDLNYRKLTGDLNWPHTTTFNYSLRGFSPTALCSLRTLKADVVVGLEPGEAELAARRQENWMISGDFAVVQYSCL